ncbi:MAG: serine/threonine protein kinase [Mojavia pulchra JT2-VF2]|jgi:serine/threonine-protein kinase|uniref:non-specific serine/threonine protein kinase n=1 Tax=Mojavia pulchra JT2-VF2 TaxID=287848 RepID=A0A951UG14_9NOST|nr:serine/threonine protein kinase [Mojavia pulchra JT2-VF2]
MLSSKLLGERYQVVEVLSQGAFCQTYKAQDIYVPSNPTRVVKHFLPSNTYPIAVEIRRRLFNREVEALKKLSNYDLVPHLLADFEDNLEFYLVQEFIEGHPLSAELSPGKCWTESKVFQFLCEVLGILNFIHSRGLIHRDVKPNNIIRRKQDNRLVLIDFGAVKPIWNELVRDQDQTSIFIPIEHYTTIAIGTPGYMPNEQQRGKPRPNSDIYALGMIGIQALTGVHPTQLAEDSNTGEIIWRHLTKVSAGLASVLNKMVHYHFQDRYKSAKETLEALLALNNHCRANQESAFLAPFLGDQAIDTTLPETLLPPIHLYLPRQELAPNKLGSQTPSLGQDSNQVIRDEVSSSLLDLDDETTNTTVSLLPDKSPLLLGLVVGALSGLALMILSYWSLQMISPVPQIENLRIQLPSESR